MSYTDKLIDEFSSEKDEETVVKTDETVKEPEPEKEPEKEPEPAKEPPKEPETVDDLEGKKPAEPKPDLSQVSKEAKAEHAFKRQLSKQKERHEAEINDLKASFQKQFDEFKASIAPKEPVKTRADFPLDAGGDDAYIAYLTQRGVDAALAEHKAKEAEDNAKAEEQRKAEAEQREANEAMSRTFGEHSRQAFPDQTAYNEYTKKVNRAIENGLGEVLDSVPAIRDYIFKNPEGPVVLNKMLSDRDSFARVMSQTDPTMMIIAAHELAREPSAPAPQPVVEEAPKVPHLGKPGARNASSDAGSMFGSDKSLLSFVRNVNSRRR